MGCVWAIGRAVLDLQVSGSTATVAVIVGWDLLVASVGDSEAYLDTGAEVIQVYTLFLALHIASSSVASQQQRHFKMQTSISVVIVTARSMFDS